jgi:hypothetical protein
VEINTWFTKWVEADLKGEEPRFNHEALVDGRSVDGRSAGDYLSWPSVFTRHDYFTYVNDEVLDSFKDMEIASDRKSGHFFIMVSRWYVWQLQGTMDRRKRKLAGKPLPEDEKLAEEWGDPSGDEMPEEMFDFTDQDTRRHYWQRFIARDLVKAYASLSMDWWLNHPEYDEQEINEIVHI